MQTELHVASTAQKPVFRQPKRSPNHSKIKVWSTLGRPPGHSGSSGGPKMGFRVILGRPRDALGPTQDAPRAPRGDPRSLPERLGVTQERSRSGPGTSRHAFRGRWHCQMLPETSEARFFAVSWKCARSDMRFVLVFTVFFRCWGCFVPHACAQQQTSKKHTF